MTFITYSYLVKRMSMAGIDLVTLGLTAQHGVIEPSRLLDVEMFSVI